MINAVLIAVLDIVREKEKEIDLECALFDVSEGPDKGKRLILFSPKGFPDIDPYYIDSAPVYAELEQAKQLGFGELARITLNLRNAIAVQLLENYIPAVKDLIRTNNLSPATMPVRETKEYFEDFDCKLVQFFKDFYKANSIDIETIESERLAPDGSKYCIRVLSSDGSVVKVIYKKASDDEGCILQIDGINIARESRGKGLSKLIINNLVSFCTTNDTDLQISQTINKEWEEYLLNNGAVLLEKDDQKGDTLLIKNPL